MTAVGLESLQNKEDKTYAAGHAIASGIIGFLVSTAVTSPFDESIHKLFNNKKFQRKKFRTLDETIADLTKQKEAGTITKEAKQTLKDLTRRRNALNTLVKNIPDWIIGVPRAILTIALIPPILKYVFGVEKKKKPATSENKNVNTNNTDTPKMDFLDKPAFEEFKGGVK